MTSSNIVFVIVHGSTPNPAHYGYLSHLLMSAGHGVVSGLLPSAGVLDGARGAISDDVDFIRNRLVRPVLENEGHDVIMIYHSSSAIVGSPAVRGMSEPDRIAAGHKTGVIGQIFIAAVLIKGGEGKSIQDTMGGAMPPHIQLDASRNLMLCSDPIPTLLPDVAPLLAQGAQLSAISPSLTSVQTVIPPLSWNEPGYQNRLGFVKTTKDDVVPTAMQEATMAESGVEWVVREVATGHSPQLAAPGELAGVILEIAEVLRAV